MKVLIFITGTLTGLALVGVSLYADKQLDRYANHSLPKPDHVGPRYMKNGRWVDEI